MSDPQFSPEVLAWLAESWDPEFMVWGPDVNDEGRGWHVVDAECEVIARCDTEAEAELVRRAVDFYNDEMERQRFAAVLAADPITADRFPCIVGAWEDRTCRRGTVGCGFEHAADP